MLGLSEHMDLDWDEPVKPKPPENIVTPESGVVKTWKGLAGLVAAPWWFLTWCYTCGYFGKPLYRVVSAPRPKRPATPPPGQRPTPPPAPPRRRGGYVGPAEVKPPIRAQVPLVVPKGVDVVRLGGEVVSVEMFRDLLDRSAPL